MKGTTEPTSSENNSSTTSLEEINSKRAMAELRKLELEIEELRRGRTWEARIGRFVPIITALISIAGFMSGLLIFGLQQAKDRDARMADVRSRSLTDYRTSFEQLLLFPSNDNMTIARVLALKQDLDELKDNLYADQKQKDQQEQRLTGSVCNLIARDFDFTKPRQVTFDIAAMQNWPEYQRGLVVTLNSDGTGETVNDAIIAKYLRVVYELEAKEPGVYRNADPTTNVADPEILIKEPQRSVINGFACHIKLLEAAKRAEQADEFDRLTGAFKLAGVLKQNFQCPPLPAIPLRPKVAAK